jgi:hypothetical protein
MAEIELLKAASRVNPDRAVQARLLELANQRIDWNRVLHLAQVGRVSALVYRNLRGIAAPIIPGPVLAELRARFEANAVHNLSLTGQLLRIVRCLQAEGIRVVPFKGPTLAVLAYGNLALREFGDLDLLVDAADFKPTEVVLRSHGFLPGLKLSANRREAYRRSLGQLPFVNGQGELLELHDRLTPSGFRFDLSPDMRQERVQTVNVLDQELTTLPTEELLLFLSAHGAKHAWNSLALVVDVAELLRSAGQLRWERIWDLARRTRGERMLQLALVLARELLDAPLPTEFTAVPRNGIVRKLADRIQERVLSGGEVALTGWERGRFHWQVRERWLDGAGYWLSLVLSPTTADWNGVDLPEGLSLLYYLLRPVRLLGKYSRRWLSSSRSRPRVGRQRADCGDDAGILRQELSGS